MKRVAILQPHYVPWIGYFEMVDRVDEFWCFDDVDFIKREWKNRNKIRDRAEGADTKWLTVPIARGCQRGTELRATRLADEPDWRRKHLDAVAEVYRRTPGFDDAYGILEAGLARPATTLADLNVGLLEDLCVYLGIRTPLRRTSTLGLTGVKTERLVAVCAAVGATAYLANNGSAAYLEPERFERAGIECSYQDYAHPTYRQASRGRELPFLSHLSILDLIANHGRDALAILRAGGRISS